MHLGGDGGYDGAFQAETLSIDLLGGYYTMGAVICQAKTGDSKEVRAEGSGRKVKGGLARLRGGLLGVSGRLVRWGAIFLPISFEGKKLLGMGASTLAAAGPDNAVARWKATWHQPCGGPSSDEIRKDCSAAGDGGGASPALQGRRQIGSDLAPALWRACLLAGQGNNSGWRQWGLRQERVEPIRVL